MLYPHSVIYKIGKNVHGGNVFLFLFTKEEGIFFAPCFLLPHALNPFRDKTSELIVNKLKKQRIFYECHIQSRHINF